MSSKSPLRTFALITAGLLVLRVLFGLITVPAGLAPVLGLVVTIVFLGGPIVALFAACEAEWRDKFAGLLILAGGVVHVAGALALRFLLPQSGVPTVLVGALVQASISVWTVGLGAWVALRIKDKNLILPVAVLLAGLDVFLVFSPVAPTAKFIKQNPEAFHATAYTVPAPRVAEPGVPTGAKIEPQAYVGPADLLFMATFLIVLRRHQMKFRETAKWLVPVMICYLIVVLAPWGLSMLPALVPIGATVLLTNRREFQLSKEERGMVLGVVFVALALAGLGLWQHFKLRPQEPQAAPSMPAGGQEPPKWEGSPSLGGSGQRQ